MDSQISSKKDLLGFIQIPFVLSSRTDLNWCEKAVLGYIYTRNNIKSETEWTLSSPDIQNVLGICGKQVRRILTKLEREKVITFAEMMVGNGHPFKTYSINSDRLFQYMGLTDKKSLSICTYGQEVPKTKGLLVHLEEDRTLKEDIRIKEDSTRNIPIKRDVVKNMKCFMLACKTLPPNKNSSLYKSMFDELVKEYDMNPSVLNSIHTNLN